LRAAQILNSLNFASQGLGNPLIHLSTFSENSHRMGSLKKRRKAKIAKHKRRKRMKENRHKKRLRYKS